MSAAIPSTDDVSSALPTGDPLTGLSLFQKAATALEEMRGMVPEHERISDDEQGVLAALAFALRADCTRRRVGCVLVDAHGRVIGTGRNGAPPGRPGCLTAGACPRGRLSYEQVAPGSSYSSGQTGACIANHAETNGVMNSDPLRRRGGTIYITDKPCDDCSRLLAGSGLARAVWPERDHEGVWHVRSVRLDSDPVGGHYADAA